MFPVAVDKGMEKRMEPSRAQEPYSSRQLPPLSDEQRQLLNEYRCGHVAEETFQDRLAADPVLSEYVRTVCHA